ncbi:hypothetical protein [Glycomyces buryatensis]|uniref:Uncharacterized protein n=1 Tax=Glycomyces buryatensis TaxID=2570927 RepID=A0A4S8Q5N5_9ACTN|nr:hypothetical protein [Glycomyces buryatensis]THV39617.1 hypothetical protein FAB82_17250 [Glycomyces buryatensis]
MARVVMHRDQIREFMSSPQVYDMLEHHTTRIRGNCEAFAPVGKTGAYKRSFFTHAGKDRRGYAVGYVGSTDPAAAHIEWGTRYSLTGPTPDHHTMASAFWASALP